MRSPSSHLDPNTEKPKRAWLRGVWQRPETAADRPDALLVFSSEQASPGRLEAPTSTAEPPELAGEPRRPVTLRRVAIGLLALVAIAEAGVIGAWWMQYGRAGVPLDPAGSVVVTSVPVGAGVSVNNVSRGVTPFRTSLAPGAYVISIGEGASAWSQTVAVTERAESSVHVQLQAPSASAADAALAAGTLQITTDPPGRKCWSTTRHEASRL